MKKRAETVRDAPVLDDAVVLDAQSIEDVCAHRARGRRVAHEGTVVGAGPGHAKEGPRAVAGATDQHEQLQLFAADIVLRLERAAPLVTIVGGASRSEPELADLLARLHAYRRNNLRSLVDALAANGSLRLPIDEAVETVWALTSPELHQLLTRLRGWTRRRYCDWLADSLARLLLR